MTTSKNHILEPAPIIIQGLQEYKNMEENDKDIKM
jgi:hypothetical protein